MKVWKEKPLGECAHFIDYRGKTPEKTPTGIRLITAKNVKMGYISPTPLEFMNADHFESRMTRGIPRRGDVLFSTEAPLGNVAQIDTDEPISIGQRLITLRPKSDELINDFLKYALISPQGQQQIHRLATGATVLGIKASLLKTVLISLPSTMEQRRIVAILDEAFAGLDAMRVNAEKNLQNARDLFDSYLNAIFSEKGEGWVETTLGDVCETQYGISGTMNSEGQGYKIFRMGEVQRGKLIDTGHMKRIVLEPNEFETYRLKKNDVLFNRTNSIDLVGKTGIYESEGEHCFASYLIRVNFDPKKVNSRFACYLMNSSAFLTRIRLRVAKSVNQANINATILRSEWIPLHIDLDRQKEYTDKLDGLLAETDRLESLYRRKLAAIAELRQSILQKAFAGELTSSESVAA